MSIILHREQIEIGADAYGPRLMEVYTFTVRATVTRRRNKGMLTVDEPEQQEPVQLPYIIWRTEEMGRVRYRWARRHMSKPEMRMGISTHGAHEKVRGCVAACIENHALREKAMEDA